MEGWDVRNVDISESSLIEFCISAIGTQLRGQQGEYGRNLFIRKDGSMLHLGGKNEINAAPGDRIRIETPGGGGFGKVDS